MTGGVLLLPDCGSGVGLGHLERMLAVAEALDGSDVYVAIPAGDDVVARRVQARGFATVATAGTTSERAVDAAEHTRPAVLVLDAYGISVATQSRIRAACPLVVVDDLGRACDADIAVNPAPGGELMTAAGAARTLAGAAYAMVARAHIEARCRRLVEPAVPGTVLVATGAMDLGGFAARLTDELVAARPETRVTFIAGPEATRRPENSATVEVVEQPPSLAPLLARSTIYAGAAGTTAVQAACVGVPAVIVPAVANQRGQADALSTAGCAEIATPQTLTEAAVRLLADPARQRRMSEAGRRLIDGEGASRVAAAILELAHAASRR